MKLGFQERAMLCDPHGGPSQSFPLLIDVTGQVADPFSFDEGSGWGRGWVLYSGKVSTHCVGPMHGERMVKDVFLAVTTEWTSDKSGKQTHTIIGFVTTAGGGHVLVESDDKLYPLLDAYYRRCLSGNVLPQNA